MTDSVTPLPTSVSPEELTAPVIPDTEVDVLSTMHVNAWYGILPRLFYDRLSSLYGTSRNRSVRS